MMSQEATGILLVLVPPMFTVSADPGKLFVAMRLDFIKPVYGHTFIVTSYDI